MKLHRLLLIMIVGLIAFSCKDDDDKNEATSPSAVANTVVKGTWGVTYFKDRDDDETGNFAGYTFVFTSPAAVTATKDSNDTVGTWTASESDKQVKLTLSFPGDDPLEELNEDWQVTERTDTSIKMKHVSGGDGHVDYLTLEKN